MRVKKADLTFVSKSSDSSTEVYSSGSIFQVNINFDRIIHVGSSQTVQERLIADCNQSNKQFVSTVTRIDLADKTPPQIPIDPNPSVSLPQPPVQPKK
jgi:hypothetical protein